MKYLDKIVRKHPIRRSEEQKKMFRDYICNYVCKDAKVECLDNKHNNILIGDIENAKVVFTAHYDTPAASLFPNIMMPRNKILGMIYQFSYPLLFAALSLGVAYLIKALLGLSYEVWLIIYIVFYLSTFYLCTRCFDNKNNYNDNTSGIATILELIKKNNNPNVAYVLFDNEEKGKLGSKAFSKKYSGIFKEKLVINFDCVGDGNNIIFVAKDKALTNEYYKVINKYIESNNNYNVEFYGMKGSLSNSDYRNFDCGVSVMACRKKKIIGYYTPRIHTTFDTYCNQENIDFIVNSLSKFIDLFN